MLQILGEPREFWIPVSHYDAVIAADAAGQERPPEPAAKPLVAPLGPARGRGRPRGGGNLYPNPDFHP